jgi:hypothetical protein
MKNKLRLFKFIIIIIAPIVFVVTCELLSYIYINSALKQTKSEFTENLKKHEPIEILSEYTAHQTLTYVSRSNLSNNMGFVTRHNYPYARNENDFVIGLFGGSVAEILSWKSDTLKAIEIIKTHVPSLREKNIVLLNFANGCAKQPMQFHRFSRFADDIDLAINIDGFNEIEFNFVGADITAPCMMGHLYPQSTYHQNFNFVRNALGVQAKSLKNKMISSSLFEKSAAFALATQFVTQLKNSIHYEAETQAYEMTSSGRSKLYPFDLKNDNRDLHFLGAKNWSKYAKLQFAVAKELNKPILFVLQPNILLKGSKPLSAEEIKLDETMLEGGSVRWSTKSANITRGYQEMQKQLEMMKNKNPHNFIDLTGIFNQKQQTIYVDPCCHYNDEGNVMLWTEIAKALPPLIN